MKWDQMPLSDMTGLKKTHQVQEEVVQKSGMCSPFLLELSEGSGSHRQSKNAQSELAAKRRDPPAGARRSPFDLRQELCCKDAPHLEPLWEFPPEEQASIGKMHQDLSHDLAQVHAADHLLIPQRAKKETGSAGRHMHLSEGWNSPRRYLCFPGLVEQSSTKRSNWVLKSSSSPASPNAPHSMLTHIRPSSPSTRSMLCTSSM